MTSPAPEPLSADESVEPKVDEGRANNQRLVLKNAFLLVVAQVLAMPLSVLVNAVMGRHLGAEDFGYFYLATTFCSFGFLAVDWGSAGALPALIAKDRESTGDFVGTSRAWRFASAGVVYAVLAIGTELLHYGPDFRSALALVALANLMGSISGIGQNAFQGFERTDVNAYAVVGQQLLGAILVVPTLLLGGSLGAALGALAAANALVAGYVWRSYRVALKYPIRVKVSAGKLLFIEGAPFLALSLVVALQPNVDALFLSSMTPAEVVGWHGAAKKLIGVLVFPVNALIMALYPTLCRLHEEDRASFASTANVCLRTSVLLVVPVALGCALFPDLGILIFSKSSFGPAEANLRLFSVFLALMYVSMTLGCTLMAAGQKRVWVTTQVACVLISVVADPLLIPWFQRRYANGGLGVGVASVLSEVVMVVAGCVLAPPGVIDRALMRGLGLSLVAGVGMGAATYLLSSLPRILTAAIAVLVYFGCLWVIGGVDAEQRDMLMRTVLKKLKKS
jgi:O-antigen/teichoic acid export membrane protein